MTNLTLPTGQYKVLLVDPPWHYNNERTGGNMKSGASQKYQTLKDEEIMALPIRDISHKDSVCFLWATVPKLPEALEVLQAWGYKYKGMLTWRKIMSMGMGFWFRGQTEHLLFGVRGNIKAFRCQYPNFVQSAPGKHSAKPRQFRRMIEVATRGLEPRIELFARGPRISGWDAFGNQIDNDALTLEGFLSAISTANKPGSV